MTRRLRVRRCAVAFSGAVLAVLTCGFQGVISAWAEARNPHSIAVIIGNRMYRNKDIPPVDYAHRDAEAFKRYVVQVLGYDPANVIHLKDATRAQMQNVLGHRAAPMNDIQARLNMLGSEGGSDVIVYYSGHGVPAEKGTPSLLPVDVAPHAAQAEGYPIELLYEKLGQLQRAKSVRVFLDTCFSGSSHGGRLVAGSPVYVVTGLPEGVGERMTVLTAVTKTQIATWDKAARHGLFTHHLLDALNGRGDWNKDGKVTAAEAKEYLDRYMTSAAWISNRRIQQATLRGEADAVLAAATDGNTFASRPALEADKEATRVAKGKVSAKAGRGLPAPVVEPTPTPAPRALDHAAVERALGLERHTRVLIQRGLAELKTGVGYIDGLFGKGTRKAVRKWQQGKGFPATGYLTREQAEALEEVGRVATEWEKKEEAERERLRAEKEKLARAQAERERREREEAERERLRAETEKRAAAVSGRADYEVARTAYKTKDYELAYKEFRKLAEDGHLPSQHYLGEMYRFGLGVGRDFKEAQRWYREPVEQGYAGSQFAMGYLYHKGLGVSRDFEKARELYLKAAERGHSTAQYNLGNMLGSGVGGHQDLVEGYKWVLLANEKRQSERWAYWLGQIEKRMTWAEIDQAKERAANWTPKPRR